MSEPRDLTEDDVLNWFEHADLQDAIVINATASGIIRARQAQQPMRKRRKDAGVKRAEEQLQLKEKA